ncbi:MAG: helix-turn-helix transcriptional regulator [Eubacteriales bacterium]|nr:helix-turn-helix transcriptional regulator [Eubacteriales bacterium]
MLLNAAVSKRITELCNERSISLNKLATLSGITQSTLNSVVKCEVSSPTLKTIYYICFALNMDLASFFSSPLFQDLDD